MGRFKYIYTEFKKGYDEMHPYQKKSMKILWIATAANFGFAALNMVTSIINIIKALSK